jgi:hypothetical protein
MHYRFHTNIFACDERLTTGHPIALRGINVTPLRALDGSPPSFRAFFPVTFYQALNTLSKLPRLDAEPDGFFVIAGESDGRRWQVDGHLYDFNDRLHRVELHGQCPPDAFDAILACLGWPATPLAFELVMEGVALEEAAFRTWACSGR